MTGSLKEEHDANSHSDMRDIIWRSIARGIHIRKSRHAVPGRDEYDGERVESHHLGKEEGLVG
jgi:hypothetical protein